MYHLCVFYGVVYGKTADIMWKYTSTFQGLVLRIGDFHTVMNFLSIIGKHFQDAGLRNITVDSGLVAERSVGLMTFVNNFSY